MSRKCDLFGIRPMSGNNVSHSNRKTKRRFLVNLKNIRLKSEVLGSFIKMKVAASTLRTINKYGDIDNFLVNYRHSKLSETAISIKKKVKKKLIKEGRLDSIKTKSRLVSKKASS
jgi:large subunit ribosomal protein L28